MNRYIYGYDHASFAWIVGLATEQGTIARIVAWFGDAESAARHAAKLNEAAKAEGA